MINLLLQMIVCILNKVITQITVKIPPLFNHQLSLPASVGPVLNVAEMTHQVIFMLCNSCMHHQPCVEKSYL